MSNKSFSGFELKHGLIFDYSENKYPTKLYGSEDALISLDNEESTYFIFNCNDDYSSLHITGTGYFCIAENMYACVPGRRGSYYVGTGLVIERIGYKGLFSIGGPIEDKGRLKYIDGCTDALLIPPVMFGDPCLNALYFIPNIDQTQHTHPSMRVGMVLSGKGVCKTPDGEINLNAGMLFIIHEEGLHSFQTFDEPMIVIAYHPDSDFGPKHEEHPMINRTIVNGESAANLDDIKTK